MAQEYKMKDLGYPRTPTTAEFEVDMPDGLWRFPVQLIADQRDEHYAEDKEDTIGFIRDGSLGTYKIYDWAGNNMNWSDISEYAYRTDKPLPKIDREQAWMEGDKDIHGEL